MTCLVIFVAIEALLGKLCPLTIWEYSLRQRAGQLVEKDISFIARIARKMIFYDLPPWVFTTAYVVFGALVLLTFFIIKPHYPGIKRNRK